MRILLLLLLSHTAFAQQKLDAGYFLSHFLGAHMIPDQKIWVLPDTATAAIFAEDYLEDGLQVWVDTIAAVKIGGKTETWVLFTIEGHIFNLARLEQTSAGFRLLALQYQFYTGAPGEYMCEYLGVQALGDRPIVTLREAWYGMGIITTNWLLLDPYTSVEIGHFDWASEGEKEQTPEHYQEFSTQSVRYSSRKNGWPDIVLKQKVKEKTAGQAEQTRQQKVKYRYAEEAKGYRKSGGKT